MGIFNNLRSLTRSPPSSSRPGRSRRQHGINYPQQGGGRDYDSDIAAAVAASLDDDVLVGAAESGDSRTHDDAGIAAAIAASLDEQEATATTGVDEEDDDDDNNSNTGASTVQGEGRQLPQPPVNPSHAAQDIAFLTDRPLLPPSSNRRGGGSSADETKEPSTLDHAAPSGQRRTRTEEDEALARRLEAQWISEDTATGGPAGAGGGGMQWLPGLITQLGTGPPAIIPTGLVCVICGLPIMGSNFRYSDAGCFHQHCVPAHDPVPPCKVCHERLPSQDGRYHFHRHNYFNDLYCPWHNDSAVRCCSCMRLEPKPRPGGEAPFAELSDDRMLCMSCAQTAVVDSSEGAPAYQDVCRFFEQELKLTVPREMREVPVLLVDSPTLNEQTHRDQSHGGSAERGMPTTRGLTLSEVATLRHMAAGAMQFNPALGRFVVGPPTQVNLGERRAVTAILVLCGLPYASFSSILAHEAMHAFTKLDPSFPSRLPSQVEEGLCQLIALLWLEHLAGQVGGCESSSNVPRNEDGSPTDADLRGFFAHQIKTDVSVVYGDGFRLAKAAYDAVGLHMLLAHVKQYQSFPVV